MEKQIEILRQKYGTYREVAKLLEVTECRIYQIKAGSKPGKSLAFRIKAEIERLLK